MMNKHYIHALALAAVAALAAKEIAATEDDVKTFIDEDSLSGNFNDDLDSIVAECESCIVSEDEDKTEPEDITEMKESVEQNIEKTVDSLKIGFNFIPGVGVGYCGNETDLENMRNYVRGVLTTKILMFGNQACACCCKANDDEEDY